jgi:hypothetical protein
MRGRECWKIIANDKNRITDAKKQFEMNYTIHLLDHETHENILKKLKHNSYCTPI